MEPNIEEGNGSPFNLDNAQLRKLNVDKSLEEIQALGGLEGIAKSLRSSLSLGISGDEDDISKRSAFFGVNVLQEPPLPSFWGMILNGLKEPIMILLIVAAIVSIILGVTVPEGGNSRKTGWIEGAAIIIAVLIVVFVTAVNDYTKEKKFRVLNQIKNDKQVKIKRNGKEDKISINTIQVGELVVLDTGDQIPADGLYIEGHELAVDEAAMTGESDAVKKDKKRPFMLSGCQVASGNGLMIVTAIGMNSEWGVTYSKLTEEPDKTPLQEKLDSLAQLIGYIGMAAAVLLFIALTIKFVIIHTTQDDDWHASKLQEFVTYLILCVSIIVVAVPEGLPLAVTISLAYSMKAMLKDNNLVRHLAACETMGGATNICSDKTGTLTENKMTVTNVWINGKIITGELETTVPAAANKKTIDLMSDAVCTNSTAFLKQHENKLEFIGNKTECALLVFSNKMGNNYNEIRKQIKILNLIPFSSEKKRMSVIVKHQDIARIYTKGASEIVLGLCNSVINEQGEVAPMNETFKENVNQIINSFASEGLRTISIAYKDLNDPDTKDLDDNLTMIGIVGIKDPLRKEVPAAIQTCKIAGITVRMVTGDNKLTATRIATDCGILEDGGIVMEGPEFRALSDEQLDAILPKLKVLARSSPSDKHRLVTRLKENREVVAVTGDGINDGPALKAADVGLAMGIAGTEIAKEASDIIIMDDNFASVVKAVMWGRSVRGNIQRFLQFQLTVNGVAVIVAFVAALSSSATVQPLNAIQLLWVNLIQDTMAALALATEKPAESLLLAKPAGRHERLITPRMWRFILIGVIYQLIVLFGIIYAGDKLFNIHEDDKINKNEKPSIQYTMVFNTFVLMATVNELNARRLDDYWNCLYNLFKNYIFMAVIFITCAVQVLLIEVGDVVFSVVALNWKYWLICVGLGLSMFPLGVITRAVVPAPDFDFVKYERDYLNSEAHSGVGSIPGDETELDKTEKKFTPQAMDNKVTEMELP